MNEKVLIGFNRHYYPKLINLQQPIFIKLISCCQWCLESLFETYRNCPPRQNNYFVKKVPRPDVVFLWCLLTWQSQKPHTRLVLSCDVQQFCRHSGASLHFSFSSLQENRWVLAIFWLNWVCVLIFTLKFFCKIECTKVLTNCQPLSKDFICIQKNFK